jgi:hypothetical protein
MRPSHAVKSLPGLADTCSSPSWYRSPDSQIFYRYSPSRSKVNALPT